MFISYFKVKCTTKSKQHHCSANYLMTGGSTVQAPLYVTNMQIEVLIVFMNHWQHASRRQPNFFLACFMLLIQVFQVLYDLMKTSHSISFLFLPQIPWGRSVTGHIQMTALCTRRKLSSVEYSSCFTWTRTKVFLLSSLYL